MSAQAPTGTERRTTGRFRRPGQVSVEDHGMRRDVGRIGLLFASVGSIIGPGWLFGALTASTIAGPAAIISWVLGGRSSPAPATPSRSRCCSPSA